MMYKIRFFIPFAVLITCLCGLVYGTVQQVYRMSANDPQIQLAEDYAVRLQNSLPGQVMDSQVKTDIGASLAPFLIVYGADGKPVAATATLNGKVPTVPLGVLSVAKNKEDRVTWQPESGVRIAAVVKYYSNGLNSGYILAGRNIREIEIREAQLAVFVGLAWVVTMIATFLAVFLFIPAKHHAK